MAQAGHHRDRTGRQVPGQVLVIEDRKVFPAAAPPGQDDGFNLRVGAAFDHLGQALSNRAGHHPLHGDRDDVDRGRRPALLGCAQHVRQGGAGHARHQGNRRWHLRQCPLALGRQEALRLQHGADPLELPQHRAQGWPDVQDLNAEVGAAGPEVQLADHEHPIPFAGLVAQALPLGGPDHPRDRRRFINQGQPEVALFQLRP